jgi:hypothetical protein
MRADFAAAETISRRRPVFLCCFSWEEESALTQCRYIRPTDFMFSMKNCANMRWSGKLLALGAYCEEK